MRSHSYINSIRVIIDEYDGEMPLAPWLKHFFRTDKKFGSKDRKTIGHACYCYYRLGNAFAQTPFTERLFMALFLASTEANLILREQRPDWNDRVTLSLSEKIDFIKAHNEINFLFPWKDSLSNEINKEEFNLSFLIQPDLFLRIRPRKKDRVLKKLDQAQVSYNLINEDAVRLSNSTKIDDILSLDEEIVIQDLNS
ncbi:MAG TPA: hypothetical protein VNS32_16640, partial [Flavisolibacter sp.]|nr:hypothetical protein [Flavisolibacter sp.]